MTWQEDDEPGLWEQIPSWVNAMGRILLRLFIIGVVLSILVAVFYWILASRYDMKEVVEMQERTLLLDRDGKELAAIHGSRRRVISYQEIPPSLIAALTTREDKEFFQHGGVHFRGIVRATFRNLADRQISQGASTLTMQLARNCLLYTSPSPRDQRGSRMPSSA